MDGTEIYSVATLTTGIAVEHGALFRLVAVAAFGELVVGASKKKLNELIFRGQCGAFTQNG